jgi:hypothetical protein
MAESDILMSERLQIAAAAITQESSTMTYASSATA